MRVSLRCDTIGPTGEGGMALMRAGTEVDVLATAGTGQHKTAHCVSMGEGFAFNTHIDNLCIEE